MINNIYIHTHFDFHALLGCVPVPASAGKPTVQALSATHQKLNDQDAQIKAGVAEEWNKWVYNSTVSLWLCQYVS